jgi:ankyrin repeat protein
MSADSVTISRDTIASLIGLLEQFQKKQDHEDAEQEAKLFEEYKRLFLCVDASVVNGARAFIAKYPDICRKYKDETDKEGRTALYCACCYGNAFDIVQFFVGVGADVNKGKSLTNSNGMTPLMVVLYDGTNRNNNTVKLLVDAGADVNATDKRGLTALYYASWGSSTFVKFLIDNGAHLHVNGKFQLRKDWSFYEECLQYYIEHIRKSGTATATAIVIPPEIVVVDGVVYTK